MKALEMLKNMYTWPQGAFDQRRLAETLKPAIIGGVLVTAVNSGIALSNGYSKFYVFFFQPLSLLIWLAVAIFLERFLVRRQGKTLPVRAYLSGLLWIMIALAPLGWVEPFVPSAAAAATGTLFAVLYMLLAVVLDVFCLQSLTGLPAKEALVISLLGGVGAFLSLTLLSACLFLFGVNVAASVKEAAIQEVM
jgi:hypothetical protein